MKRLLVLIITSLFISSLLFAQPADQKEYYSDIDFNKSGTALKSELTDLLKRTHTRTLNYGQIWDVSKITDINPNNNSDVLLLYGWPEGTTSDYRKDYSRDKDNNGGKKGQWNREHTYAKSLGTPNLEIYGPGADAHHLRPCDIKWNAARGNLKFAEYSGKTGTIGKSGKSNSGWYPGDEWKGDVARMMMYMYVRYQTRCLPANVGIGNTSNTPDGMIDLFLKWNAEDPVSEIEIQRNNYHSNINNSYAQGNRNPFIDNPYLATKIWGGIEAEDRWGNLSTSKTKEIEFIIYPNPTFNQEVFLQTKTPLNSIKVTSLLGQTILYIKNPETQTPNNYRLENIPKGYYIIQVKSDYGEATRKLLVK